MAPDSVSRRVARGVGAGGLLLIAGMHAGWASGRSWPASDERSLAQAVIGRDEMPSAVACSIVAGMLLVAAVPVAGYPKGSARTGWIREAGLLCVVGSLLLRGLVGAFELLPPQRDSEVFARMDRRLYSPICLALALICAYGGDRTA